jgi:hypothetical protein
VRVTSRSAVQGSTPSSAIVTSTSTAEKKPTTRPTTHPTADKPSASLKAPATQPTTQPTSDPTTESIPSNPGQLVRGSSDLTIATRSPAPFAVIGSQTIMAGQASATVSRTLISLQTDGASLITGSQTLAVTSLFLSSTYAIVTQTFTPRAAVTITGASGTSIVSLEKGGSSVVVGGSTIPVSQFAGLTAVTASVIATYVLGTQTLVPGGSGITVTSATGTSVVSLETGGSSVVVGGSTIPVNQLSGLTTASGTGKIVLSMSGYATTSLSAGSTGSKFGSSSMVQATAGVKAGYNGTVLTGTAPRSWGSRDLGLSLAVVLLMAML